MNGTAPSLSATEAIADQNPIYRIEKGTGPTHNCMVKLGTVVPDKELVLLRLYLLN